MEVEMQDIEVVAGRNPGPTGASADELIMRIAADQHGLVSRAQLLGAGVSEAVIDRRARGAWLRRIRRGVYAVGPVSSPRMAEMAAVLACGAGSVLSYWSASGSWELRARPETGAVDVSVTGGHAGRLPGIRVHRTRTLGPDDVTVHLGVPVTTVVRTLYDLARVASDDEMEQMVAEAYARRLTDCAAVLAAGGRYRGRPGTARLMSLAGSDVARTRLRDGRSGRRERRGRNPNVLLASSWERIRGPRSEAEARFLRLVRRADLPGPRVNVWVSGHQVDFFWRRECIVVEVDGYRYHSSVRAYERDRQRDATLAAAGIRVIRVTWRQIVREHEALLVRLTRALSGCGSTAEPSKFRPHRHEERDSGR
jgi:very-short-patch-repair endonuclease